MCKKKIKKNFDFNFEFDQISFTYKKKNQIF